MKEPGLAHLTPAAPLLPAIFKTYTPPAEACINWVATTKCIFSRKQTYVQLQAHVTS